ncbi:MAG: hypothetical protein PHC44_08695, partial [Lutispora sp.]|nr:hypothetical protein [Lutispora sp.]
VSIIFERINSTAKTLTVFDLMVAATWFEKFDLRDHIDFLKKELQKKHFSNAIIALLSNQKPRNLITGTKIDLTKALSVYNRKEFHHIFPVAFLKSNKIDGITLNNINSVCNIIILSSSENKQIGSKAPSKFFTGSHNTFLN